MKEEYFSADWREDCFRYHGRLLTGKMGHWCNDWDHLPVDETCREYSCCSCKKWLMQHNKNLSVAKRLRSHTRQRHSYRQELLQVIQSDYNSRIQVAIGDYLGPIRFGPL